MRGRRRIRKTFVSAATALVVVTCAGAADGARLSPVRGPAHAETGEAVAVVVSARRAGRALVGAGVSVWIRKAGTTRTFAARGLGAGRYRALVVFPAPGRWTLGARVAGTSRALRGVVVGTVFHVREPFRAADGSLLVADGAANRILRVDAATGATSSFAGNGSAAAPAPAADARVASIGRPIEVAADPGGGVVFVSDEKVWRIDRGSFALTHIAGDGAVYVPDTYGDRVRRLVVGGAIATHARGFSGPTGLTMGPGGSLYVAETQGAQVSRVDPSGRVQRLVTGGRPTGVVVLTDGRLVVSLSGARGKLVRLDPGSGRVTDLTR
jgi:sugar lactone lactonase YvrE